METMKLQNIFYKLCTTRSDQSLLAEMLSSREFIVITMRFGVNGERNSTLREIGKKLDVSAERIRQIEATALRKLRRPAYAQRIVELCPEGKEFFGIYWED